MKKFFSQVTDDRIADYKKEEEEYGGQLRYSMRASGFVNSRNRPEIMAKFQSCYDGSGTDIKEVNKAVMNAGDRILSGCKRTLQARKETKPYGYSVRETMQEFRGNYSRLNTNLLVTAANLGLLENHLTKQYSIAPSDMQTVMAGVTRRFTNSEGKAMYQTIFHWGPLEEEQDFEYVRTHNDIVIALSYRHQGPNRMTEEMFLHVLDNIFQVVQVMKPGVTHIRLWVDAVASRRAQNRRWVSKGVLPYTVFPVIVCDPHFSLRRNRTWINIETILGVMGMGLIVFDQNMVRDMGLVSNADDADDAKSFYFRGARSESMENLKLLASVVLRGALDLCEITWREDWQDIIGILSRAAVADSMGARQALLTQDDVVDKSTDVKARSLIRTLLGYETSPRTDLHFLELRPLNTHIEYVWSPNTPYRESHKLAVQIKHLGSIDRAVLKCAEDLLQKDESVWLMIGFETYQVAVEFHKEWERRKHVRLVHLLTNASAFEGCIMKSFVTCWTGERDVNYRYFSIHSMEYMSNAINILKIIAKLQGIGAVDEQSTLQKFWFVKNKDVRWTMGPCS